jgi:signal transduction histidine kinase
MSVPASADMRPVPAVEAAGGATAALFRRRGGLFRKYIALFLALTSMALILHVVSDLYVIYRMDETLLAQFQADKADTAARRIEQFFAEIEGQIGWTTHFQWASESLDQQRFDYVRLLRQVPAITEIAELDHDGKQQLKVSRLATDVVGGDADFSKSPEYTAAMANGIWFGPVTMRKQSEPYLTMAVAESGRAGGVTVAEVNLKLIWDVISGMEIGHTGLAYVVDRSGRLIAHPDISLVLRNTDFSQLPYVAAALANVADRTLLPRDPTVETNIAGVRVLTAYAPLPKLGWLMFVELPMREVLAPVYSSAGSSMLVLLAALVFATLAAIIMVRRLIGPIRLLQAGAARIGAGDLDSRIVVRTGDELEDLAAQFNTMADQLRDHHAGLERTVEERTRDLARSIGELQALSDVARVVNSTLDLNVVLKRIVTHAVELSQAEGGAIFRHNFRERTFAIAESSGLDASLVHVLTSLRIVHEETAMTEAAQTRQAVQLIDMTTGAKYPLKTTLVAAGFHSALIVPLIGPEQVLGALVLVRRIGGTFAVPVIELMSTFANQSALAMQNAELFEKLADRGRQLQLASEHKSQFLANMSHELRTPLNAILGYTELLADGIYGELPERACGVLQRVLENGRHLLALINDVLDLAKIEAGELTLGIEDYHVAPLVHNVMAAMEPLARAKHLVLLATTADDMPAGHGDARRLQQVLVNLVGNAIKFTDAGEVEVSATEKAGRFRIVVRDTGPGIAPDDQQKIFEEFQQIDNSSTRRKGGTGLGLAISRRIVELHGGRLSVESTPGQGATFHVDIPVRVECGSGGAA